MKTAGGLGGSGTDDPHAAHAGAWEPRRTLTGREYWSEDVFALERERLFHGGWFCVGRTDDAPALGAFVVVDLAGESILIVRGEDGVLRGFLNVCRHRGSELCQGAGRLRTIRCPYHAWSYGLDGSPPTSGPRSDSSARSSLCTP